MNPADYLIAPDPNDARRLLMNDGRPVLCVIGGGHDNPFSRDHMAKISAWVCAAWNAGARPTANNDDPRETQS